VAEITTSTVVECAFAIDIYSSMKCLVWFDPS
jgi:hypothetical protein